MRMTEENVPTYNNTEVRENICTYRRKDTIAESFRQFEENKMY